MCVSARVCTVQVTNQPLRSTQNVFVRVASPIFVNTFKAFNGTSLSTNSIFQQNFMRPHCKLCEAKSILQSSKKCNVYKCVSAIPLQQSSCLLPPCRYFYNHLPVCLHLLSLPLLIWMGQLLLLFPLYLLSLFL